LVELAILIGLINHYLAWMVRGSVVLSVCAVTALIVVEEGAGAPVIAHQGVVKSKGIRLPVDDRLAAASITTTRHPILLLLALYFLEPVTTMLQGQRGEPSLRQSWHARRGG